MPKFKILVTMGKLSVDRRMVRESLGGNMFESRAEAQEAYHALIAKLEGEVNRVQETLDAVVEHGHIVEVE